MLQIDTLQKKRTVRQLEECDIPSVLRLCKGNPLYFRYCPPDADEESIHRDMNVTPSGISADRKYYLGIYEGNDLLAVMDLIDGYPYPDTAYIGFFMMEQEKQGKGIGTQVIGELLEGLTMNGFRYVRLGYITANPQAAHFWEKNGFEKESQGRSLTVEGEITRAVLDLKKR